MLLLLWACGASPPPGGTTIETGHAAACRSQIQGAAEACYRAALEDPDSPHIDLYLSPACTDGIADACRRLHTVRADRGDAKQAQISAMLGCDSGDLVLCDHLQVYADDANFAKNRDAMLEVIKKSREAAL